MTIEKVGAKERDWGTQVSRCREKIYDDISDLHNHIYYREINKFINFGVKNIKQVKKLLNTIDT